MFCTNCGKELPDNTEFCGYCGQRMNANEGNGNNSGSNYSGNSYSYEARNENIASMATNVSAKDIKDVLVSPSENVIATFGNNYLQSILLSDTAEKFAFILTDKRLYFKGIGYYGAGDKKVLQKAINEEVVDLNDITSTGFFNVGRLNIVLVVIFALLILTFGIGIILLIIYYFFYQATKGTYFTVCFNGGSFNANVKSFPAESARDFNKQIRKAKDNLKQYE